MSGEKMGRGSEAQHSKKRPRQAFNYVKEFGGAYQNLLERQINTWGNVLDRMESGHYKADDWVADVARMSTQWVRGLWELAVPWRRWLQPGDQIPSLVFVVDAHAECADRKSVPLPVGAGEDLEIFTMGFSPSDSKCLTEKHLDWDFTPGDTHLEVGLKNLHDEKGPTIDFKAHQVHRCLICCRQPQSNRVVPLASVEVIRQ